MVHFTRSLLLTRAVTTALALSGTAACLPSYAQEQEAVGAEAPIQELVVTGSRIARSEGFEAPTPLTVIDSDALLKQSANSSVRESLAQMPVFSGGYNATIGGGSPSANVAGLSTVELRYLGLVRTLVLLDGQRAVGSTPTGLVDTDNFPQQLIERVEVVTGGASAVYGSDAVAGVVNFVLDRDFTGIKGEASGGVSDRGDAESLKVSLAGGFPFADGRGHVLLSGELSDDKGIYHGTNRSWGRTARNYIINPAYNGTNGQPEYILRNDAYLSQATHGGLIVSGPLRGTAFGEGGVPYQFEYGAGVARDFFMSGGDYLETRTDDAYSLLPPQDRHNLFGRVSFELTDRITAFVQASWGENSTEGISFQHYQAGPSITVRSGNPFIPASVQTQMTSLGLATVSIGSMNYDIPFVVTQTERVAQRYVVGLDGSFDVGGSSWTWNAYAQTGKTETDAYTHNARISARYALALDAVEDPVTGATVCRSTLTNPTNGCVAWNPMGLGVNSQAALDYFLGTAHSFQTVRQDVYAATISGQPFENWAGPVSVAFTGEYRKEEATVEPDPIARVSGWHSGNHQFLDAGYHVTEAALETLVPLLADKPFADAWDLSLAYRFTDYEVSGSVSTWKVGSTYAITPDVRFRATVSRDIRAPNISELFQAQNFGLATVLDPGTGTTASITRSQAGNPNLKPEEADNLTVGVVLTPSFVPGLSLSVDYWDVDISGAIQALQAQDVVNLCASGYTSMCSRITRDGGGLITAVQQGNFNFAKQRANGIDVEASYNFGLGTLPGKMSLRLMGTRYLENVIDDGITLPNDSVGTTQGTPETVVTGTVGYTLKDFSSALTARYFSSVVPDNDFIECQTGCPASSTLRRTYDSLEMDGGFYLDVSLSYDFKAFFSDVGEARMYFNVRNLLDEDPELTPQTGVSGYLYSRSNFGRWDKLGRLYRMGVSFKF